MEFKQIQELLKAVNKSNISKLKVKEGDFEITIEQASGEMPQYVAVQPQVVASQPIAAPAPSPAAPVAESPAPAVTPTVADNTITIKSPMIGTFYRSSSPDADPFVKEGDKISVGQTVCIVEAMKLFNEIESEVSGKIVKVLLDNASPVEFDQPLFLVDPS